MGCRGRKGTSMYRKGVWVGCRGKEESSMSVWVGWEGGVGQRSDLLLKGHSQKRLLTFFSFIQLIPGPMRGNLERFRFFEILKELFFYEE